MKNKKLAVLLLAIVTAFTMLMAVACKTASDLQSGDSQGSTVEISDTKKLLSTLGLL